MLLSSRVTARLAPAYKLSVYTFPISIIDVSEPHKVWPKE